MFPILTGFGLVLMSVFGLFKGEKISIPAVEIPSFALPTRTVAMASPQPSSLPKPECGNLYKVICQNSIDSSDPTGYVHADEEGEKQAHDIYKEIIHSHPEWNSEQVDDAFVGKVFNSQNRARIETAFLWVKRTIQHIIDKEPNGVFTLNEKNQIKDRIRRVELQIPPPASLYQDEPDLLTKGEVIYERKITGEMGLRVGGAYVLFAKSWFNVIFSLAHELGHSIDPCEIRSAGLSFPAYDRLVGCFLDRKLIALRKNRSECGGNDQLSETFADWIAVQVTAEALESFPRPLQGSQRIQAARNSVRDLCDLDDAEIHDDSDFEFHPPPQIRIEAIFGQNPRIRHFLGCDPFPNQRNYCTFESNQGKK